MAELDALANDIGALRNAGLVGEPHAVVPSRVPRPASPAVFREVAVELLGEAGLRVGKAVDRFVRHADRMPLELHPTGDLFRRPTGLEPVHDGKLQCRVHDHLSMHGAATLRHVLGRHRMVAVELGQFDVAEEVALQLAVERRGVTAETQRDLLDRDLRRAPFGHLRRSSRSR